jgi:hypothetical protein
MDARARTRLPQLAAALALAAAAGISLSPWSRVSRVSPTSSISGLVGLIHFVYFEASSYLEFFWVSQATHTPHLWTRRVREMTSVIRTKQPLSCCYVPCSPVPVAYRTQIRCCQRPRLLGAFKPFPCRGRSGLASRPMLATVPKASAEGVAAAGRNLMVRLGLATLLWVGVHFAEINYVLSALPDCLPCRWQ